ncbi:hypothetical protein PFISCL1PPCAC_19503 [Pristionchus fissidentatus]|uniref:Uncharacterized protein n=1 Tax=Pristionchus fissidentatus TaxID=1538716 RepID=A0AAV5WBL3_9BILA|nr:hypothetical protein PFISCL1PPCAC_19503 [Pristionchus fissidentatus]
MSQAEGSPDAISQAHSLSSCISQCSPVRERINAYAVDDSAISLALRHFNFSCHKKKVDTENALKSVFNGGNTVEMAAHLFDVDFIDLVSIHNSIVASSPIMSHLLPTEESLVPNEFKRRTNTRKQVFTPDSSIHYNLVPSRPLPPILRRPPARPRFLIRLVKPPEDGSFPSRVSILDATGLYPSENEIVRAEDPVWFGQQTDFTPIDFSQGILRPFSITDQLYEEEVSGYIDDAMEEEVDVTSLNDVEQYEEMNEYDELETNEGENEENDGSMVEINEYNMVTGKGREVTTSQIFGNHKSVYANVVTKYRSEITNALNTVIERSYLPEQDLATLHIALVQLLESASLPISVISRNFAIPRNRLSSFYCKLKKILELPPDRSSFRLNIIENIRDDEGQINNHQDQKATIDEIDSAVKQVFSNYAAAIFLTDHLFILPASQCPVLKSCGDDTRIRMYGAVRRVVMGDATAAEASDEEHLHPLSVWRYAKMVREKLGDRAPRTKRKMRQPVIGGRDYVVLNSYGQPVQKRTRKKRKIANGDTIDYKNNQQHREETTESDSRDGFDDQSREKESIWWSASS